MENTIEQPPPTWLLKKLDDLTNKKTEIVVESVLADRVRNWVMWLSRDEQVPLPSFIGVYTRNVVALEWYPTSSTYRFYLEIYGASSNVELSVSKKGGGVREESTFSKTSLGASQFKQVRDYFCYLWAKYITNL